MSALSSKALFRATKPKRVADLRQAPLMAVERSVRPEAEARRADDFYPTGLPGAVLRSYYDWSDSPAPAIITNPPFCEINARDGHGRWLKHSLDMPGWRYMALLLSWDWPAARANGLGALLEQHPFSYCYLMRWKLDFTGAGSPPQRNAWFVWDRDDQRAEPGFRWLDREDGRQAELFGGAGT